MGNRKEVLIIIPAYNEEKTIVPVLEKLEQPEAVVVEALKKEIRTAIADRFRNRQS